MTGGANSDSISAHAVYNDQGTLGKNRSSDTDVTTPRSAQNSSSTFGGGDTSGSHLVTKTTSAGAGGSGGGGGQYKFHPAQLQAMS